MVCLVETLAKAGGFRARLPIDGRLATRGSADRPRKSVRSPAFQLYTRQYIS